jgi:hypothetical protein
LKLKIVVFDVNVIKHDFLTDNPHDQARYPTLSRARARVLVRAQQLVDQLHLARGVAMLELIQTQEEAGTVGIVG